MKLIACALGVLLLMPSTVDSEQTSPGAGPIIVLDTAKGVIEIETYPEEAPKTVAQIVGLVQQHFYDGLRFHRAEPDFLIQVGDPASRDMSAIEWWGRASSGKPIGTAEITKKRRHLRGAVAMAAITRHWSTVLNGSLPDEMEFRGEVDRIVANAKKAAKR